jgi:Carboxypeptidase regulatory-like domain
MQFRKATCIKLRPVVRLLVAMASFYLPQAQAQTITSSIAGRVVDVAGAVVPNAKVNVRNTDVASTRTLTSGADGAFRVTGLSSGAYTVEGRAGGLASRRPLRLTVTLGSSTEIVLRLEVATVKQSTTVGARGATVEGNTVAPPTNTAEATVGSFLRGLTVTYLPNRDRDFMQFTSQAAAADDDPDGSGVVIVGQRSNAVAVEVDGTRFTDPLLGGPRGKEDGVSFLPAQRRSRVPNCA